VNEALIFVAAGLAVLALAATLLWPRSVGTPKDPAYAKSGEIPELRHEDLVPRHAKYFPLVKRALSGEDLAQLGERIPRGMRRALRSERRKVARHYLAGLHDDFVRIERFGRLVAALSPKVDAQQEAERLRLSARFRLVYALILVRLAIGQVPVPEFERLTQLIGSLASRLEAAMTSIVEPGPTQADADLGA
jgi:hypothetical protein